MSDECVGYLRDVNDGENIFEVFEGKLTIGRQEANNVRNSTSSFLPLLSSHLHTRYRIPSRDETTTSHTRTFVSYHDTRTPDRGREHIR